MKIYLRIIILLFILTTISCKVKPNTEKNEKRYSTLKIIVDSASNFYFDTPEISSNSFKRGYTESIYDSAYGTLAFIFDSVENGNLDISLQSLLDRNFSKKILFKGNTTIFFSKSELPNYKKVDFDSLHLNNLSQGGKICITFSSNGCFHSYNEKTIIEHRDKSYFIEFSSNNTSEYSHKPIKIVKRFDSTFSKPLTEFISSLQEFRKKGLLGFCTTTNTYYISHENLVYTLNDGTCSDEINYHNISSWINSK